MTCIPPSQTLVLDLPPSCIEFCPLTRNCFVVGTYFLEKKEREEKLSADDEKGDDGENEGQEDVVKESQTRTGSLVLFGLIEGEVTKISTTSTPYAILDIHFSPHDPTLLAVAASTGLLELFRFNPSPPSLSSIQKHQYFDPSILVLSLAWHPKQEPVLGITTSTGGVYICDTSKPVSSTTEDVDVETVEEVHTHDLEAWTLSFSPNTKAIFSGGDDAALKFSEKGEEESFLQWTDRKTHAAGVTAILPLVDEENVLVTGSYDDCIRVLRAPQMGRREVLAEENLEGGVWRLKLLVADSKTGRYVVLASCMHAGARIAEIQRDAQGHWQINVLAKFEEHKSMNYGSDVQPGCSTRQTIISTSFYDKLLCLWHYELS